MSQLRLRWIWITARDRHLTIWLQIGGRKPLAHLSRWERRLLHLPSIRWRLWPRPWNLNGPVKGYRRAYREVLDHRLALWQQIHDMGQEMPTERRVYWFDSAEEILR